MRTAGPLICRETGQVVVERLQIADGFWSRFVGLQFRKSLPVGNGLLLVPCPSIHTAFMRFPIDVMTLDHQARVLEVHRELRPWRVLVPQTKPFAILELPAATATLEPGGLLCLQTPPGDASLPKHLQFLQFNCSNAG